MKMIIFTDGGARGNPGPSGIGGVIYTDAGKLVGEVSEYIGNATNNVAEYTALLRTLENAYKIGATEVECYLDSQLVVRQMNREYKVKDPKLASIFMKVHSIVMQIGKVTFAHIPREKNKEADALVNTAIDAHLGTVTK